MKKEDEIVKALEHLADQVPIGADHELRFEKRLREPQKGRVLTLNISVVKLAAAAVVVIAIGIFWWSSATQKAIARSGETIQYPLEVLKAEQFYKSNADYDQGAYDQNDTTVTAFIGKLHMLEAEYKNLDSMYQYNASNEHIIRGMIENFQFRLQIIHQLKTYIELKNQSKSKQHEIATT